MAVKTGTRKKTSRVSDDVGTNGASRNGVGTNGGEMPPLAENEKPGFDPRSIVIPPLEIGVLKWKIVGTTPLIVHNLSEKARRQLVEDQMEEKKKRTRDPRNPLEECKAALYMMPGSPKPGEKGERWGIPASGLKKACETAAMRFVPDRRLSGMFVKGAFMVLDDESGLVEIKSKSGWRMREDAVRIGKQKDILYIAFRPEFRDWSCEFLTRYNASLITPRQIATLLQYAGFHVGYGELRPEKGYSNGQFQLDMDGSEF